MMKITTRIQIFSAKAAFLLPIKAKRCYIKKLGLIKAILSHFDPKNQIK